MTCELSMIKMFAAKQFLIIGLICDRSCFTDYLKKLLMATVYFFQYLEQLLHLHEHINLYCRSLVNFSIHCDMKHI
jgi:hypothetical protein